MNLEISTRKQTVEVPNLEHQPTLDRFKGYTNIRKSAKLLSEIVDHAKQYETEMLVQRLIILWKYRCRLTMPEIEQRLRFHDNPDFRRTFRQIRTLIEKCEEMVEREGLKYDGQ